MVPYLPDDMIIDVLSRLPAKSVYRFRCVSNSWLALICPHFLIRLNPNHQKLLVLFKDRFSISDCHEATADFDGKPAKKTYRYPFQSFPENSVILASSENWFLLSYGHGSRKLLLLNPLTGELRQFQSSKEYDPCHDYFGIYYDYSCNDYMVVHIELGRESPAQRPSFTVFSFKTNSWTSLKYLPQWINNIYGHGVPLNGALHWVCDIPSETPTLELVILRFDVKDEFVEFPQPPQDWIRGLFRIYNLCILRGNLCAYAYTRWDSVGIQVMEMKQYGAKESWTLVCSISLSSTYEYLKPLAFTKKGELVMIKGKELVIYKDSSSRTLTKVQTLMEVQIQQLIGAGIIVYGDIGSGIIVCADSPISLSCNCRNSRSSQQYSLEDFDKKDESD